MVVPVSHPFLLLDYALFRENTSFNIRENYGQFDFFMVFLTTHP